MQDYNNIYEVPFAFTATHGGTKKWLDKPNTPDGGAVIHMPYQGNLNGYYYDVFIPYHPEAERGKIYIRISNHSKPYFDWISVGDDTTTIESAISSLQKMVLYPYSELSMIEYSNIYEIPFSCITLHGSINTFADIPSNVTGAAVVHFPYTTNISTGYYIDIVFPYNPQSKRNIYFRVSSKSGAYFDWKCIEAISESDKPKYVAFGDSITRGYRGSKNGQNMGVATKPYPIAIAEKLKFSVVNEGVDGTGWTVDLNNTGATGYEKVMNYDLSNIDIVTIAFGINDYNGSSVALSTIEQNIKNVIEHILTTYPKITLILITPLFCALRGSSPNYCFNTNGAGNYTLQELTDLIVNTCKTYKVPVINQSEICMINHLNFNELLNDGLHPTEDGYIKYDHILAGQVSNFYSI